MMRILIATTNPHKLDEIRAVMNHPWLELLGLGDLDGEIAEPIEDGETFEANAIKKAEHYARHSGLWTLADDSGLEVDALSGRPGVRSARYSGADGPRDAVDLANNRKLLGELEGVRVEDRSARFVCAMALAWPPLSKRAPGHGILAQYCVSPQREPGILLTVRGTIEGRILMPGETSDPAHPERGRGTHGFGYDPLFLASAGRTTAEMSPDEKNAISHRGEATRAMWAELRSLLTDTCQN